MTKKIEKTKLDTASLQAVAGGTYWGNGSYGYGGHKGTFSFNGGNNGSASSFGLVNVGSGNRS